jgi:hypothetical protein
MATAAKKPINPTAAEALAEPVAFTYADVDYVVPSTSEWPYAALEAFEDGKLSGFIREILGEEQHDRFKATKPKVSDLSDLIQEMQKALGIAGE